MIRGEKFEVDLGGDDEPIRAQQGAFVGDVLERRSTAAAAPPVAPTLRNGRGGGGFPEHPRRDAASKLKQRNAATTKPGASAGPFSDEPGKDGASLARVNDNRTQTWEEEEKQQIDVENRQKLAQMSTEEIEEEKQELMSSLSPALLKRLLQRSNIDSGSSEADLSSEKPPPTKKAKATVSKSVSFAEPTEDTKQASYGGDVTRHKLNNNQETVVAETLPQDNVHFPQPSQPPDLDPSSETFLKDLHQKYFPSLPSDPEKLEWMQKSGSADGKYDPNSSAFSPEDIRFSFKGDLIPPKLASEIPVTAGLHHHGDAPEAAGYTIPELSHLAHSSYPAQRCIAFQTLGRVLYRLGKGEFGDSGEPGAGAVGAENTFGELARGLWGQVEKEKVIETLIRESEGKGADRGRHMSAKAYATEAVWLWRRGGGRRWKAE